MPFDGIEAYDVFFTKERYALRALESVGLRNLHYLPMYCVPSMHHPVDPHAGGDGCALPGPSASSAAAIPIASASSRSSLDLPLKLWGGGWQRAESPDIRARVAGGPVWGRAKLAIYCGSTLSLNHHHPMNDIVGVNTRAFELRRERRLPGGGPQGRAARAVHPRAKRSWPTATWTR